MKTLLLNPRFMKRLFSIWILISIGAILLPSGVHGQSDSSYSSSSDSTNWEAKKVETQNKSTQMRKEYYEKYKTKWYDVSLLTADVLDGSKTDESTFWKCSKKYKTSKKYQNERHI